jgi:Protein of unknown function (DUF3106)
VTRIRHSLRALPWVAAVALSAGLTAAATPESGPAWVSLTAAQQQALAPLQRDWGSIPLEPKQKWLEVAGRLPNMSAEERARVQERMAEWSRMTPAERVRARVQFQEVRRISPEERQTRWQQYQLLPDDERSQLAERARAERDAARAAATTAGRPASPGGQAPSKSSVVRTPGATASVGVANSLQQAKPGATTTTISTRPAPPVHHQAGLPKIVATPGFVDGTTLLPKRGPQGAAVRAASAASAADPEPHP